MDEAQVVLKEKVDQCTFLIKKKTSWVDTELLEPKLLWELVLHLLNNTMEQIMLLLYQWVTELFVKVHCMKPSTWL